MSGRLKKAKSKPNVPFSQPTNPNVDASLEKLTRHLQACQPDERELALGLFVGNRTGAMPLHEAQAAVERLWAGHAVREPSASYTLEPLFFSACLGEHEAASGWDFSFSDRFRKDIAHADAKLRGRILNAMATISEEPMGRQGDTLKPLNREFEGLWRYRIGDYRLVYEPNEASRRVTLMWFDSRGDVYD